jgi:hypothetical protein
MHRLNGAHRRIQRGCRPHNADCDVLRQAMAQAETRFESLKGTYEDTVEGATFYHATVALSVARLQRSWSASAASPMPGLSWSTSGDSSQPPDGPR